MKTINSLLRKCKTLKKQLSRVSSFGSLIRSKSSTRNFHAFWYNNSCEDNVQEFEEPSEMIFVGSMKKRYVISSEKLNHPLVNALVEKSRAGQGVDPDLVSVRCEVVLFDHLLWMLENADVGMNSDCLEELTELYAY